MAGKYVLKAKNKHGEDSAEVQIDVFGKPTTPTGLQVSPHLEQDMFTTCFKTGIQLSSHFAKHAKSKPGPSLSIGRQNLLAQGRY